MQRTENGMEKYQHNAPKEKGERIYSHGQEREVKN